MQNLTPILLALLLLPTACGERSEPTEASSEAETPSGTDIEMSKEERELLEALGYVYFSADEPTGETGVVRHDPERAFPGYSLYTIRHRCRAELVDMEGRVVHAWEKPPCRFWSTADLLPSGDLLVTGMDLTGNDRKESLDAMFALRLAWDGTERFKRAIPAHHDLEQTPRGDLLTLVGRYRTLPAVYPDAEVKDEWLTLLTPDGETIAEASVLEILQKTPEIFRMRKINARLRDERQAVELFHANSIEWMNRPELFGTHRVYGPNHILTCLRNQDTIAIIDWEARRLVWAWGKGKLELPHHPTLLANGNILLFDNGVRRRTSRVLEVDPRTDEIVWEYPGETGEPFFSANRGSNERLPNGNTLIADSDSGRAFEVTREGETVWEYLVPDVDDEGRRATIERIKRYPLEAFADRIGSPAEAAPLEGE